MRVQLKALLLFAVIFVAAYAARLVLVPNVVAVADSEQPQSGLQLAFVLTSVEFIGLGGIILVLAWVLSVLFGRLSGNTTAR